VNSKVAKHIQDIEKLEDIKNVSKVLEELENKGLSQASIASGYIRGYLTNTTPSDIDILYFSKTHFLRAREILKDAIKKYNLEYLNWDIEGIWSVQIAAPYINSVQENLLLYYVNSIDTVYLVSDGKLHDPTGYGFEDSLAKTLRMNDFRTNGYKFYKDLDIVYLCLEGCRRIAKYGWHPTKESEDIIRFGLSLWKNLSLKDKDYIYTKRIQKKYLKTEIPIAKRIYDQYGWGFIFDKYL